VEPREGAAAWIIVAPASRGGFSCLLHSVKTPARRRRYQKHLGARRARRRYEFQIHGEKSRVAEEKNYGSGTTVVVAFDNVLSMFSALTDVTVNM